MKGLLYDCNVMTDHIPPHLTTRYLHDIHQQQQQNQKVSAKIMLVQTYPGNQHKYCSSKKQLSKELRYWLKTVSSFVCLHWLIFIAIKSFTHVCSNMNPMLWFNSVCKPKMLKHIAFLHLITWVSTQWMTPKILQ
jgi:hypothetical protein